MGDGAMGPFHRLAFFTVTRDAAFVTLAASTLMLAFSFQPALAFGIGANIALAFSLGLILRAARLNEDRVTRTEPWRVLEPDQRPAGPTGQRQASDDLKGILLHNAKAAATIAIALYSSSLISSLGRETTRAAHAVLTASLN
jgi:hypothetical protein